MPWPLGIGDQGTDWQRWSEMAPKRGSCSPIANSHTRIRIERFGLGPAGVALPVAEFVDTWLLPLACYRSVAVAAVADPVPVTFEMRDSAPLSHTEGFDPAGV